MSDWKYHAKFVGKLITYLGLGIIMVGSGYQIPYAIVGGFIAVIGGCAAHEYSE